MCGERLCLAVCLSFIVVVVMSDAALHTTTLQQAWTALTTGGCLRSLATTYATLDAMRHVLESAASEYNAVIEGEPNALIN